ncbi:MAG: hypothetical protein ACD_58C00059G0003 [uncultured bacterium]|nr:MAG: hypothetical protein ACD_58C00059G0003 [uncultured bacterium]
MLDISSNNKEGSVPQNPATLVTESEISGLNKMENSKVVQIFCFIVLGLFVAMTIFVYALVTSKSTQLTNAQSNYDNLLNQLNSDKDLVSVNKLAEKFDNGLSKITSFISGRATWSVFLGEIQKITPPDVVYKSINVAEKTYVVTINGEASSYNSVKMLLANLRVSDKFTAIKLISATQVENIGLMVNFAIEAQVIDKNLTPKS